MTEELIFAGYPVFTATPGALGEDRDVAKKEIRSLLEAHGENVEVRGVYSLAGFRGDADLMFWWVARSADAIQDLLVEFRKTQLGQTLTVRENFLGLVRPAEFTKDHQPAFLQGKEPKKYISVYPFVRTPEWYLLPPDQRGGFLRDHGEAGREFPDVWANTTSAFGLGDFEWILCFEADSPDRIVELIRRLRATEARLYTKVEIPFFAGIRKELEDALGDLP